MSKPINCFPSNFRESVESDGEEEGEEFVLSRCPFEEFVHSEGRALEAEPGDGDQGGPIS